MRGLRTDEGDGVRALRGLMAAIIAFTIVGTSVELLLLGHYESRSQWVPLISFAVGSIALVAFVLSGTRATIKAFRMVMAGFVLVGVAGLYFHMRGNLEFASETYPAMKGWALWWEAATGATPLLAPGTMMQVGLLGLAAVYRYPNAQTKT